MTTPVALPPRVRIVILNYNGGEYVLDSVEYRQIVQPGTDRIKSYRLAVQYKCGRKAPRRRRCRYVDHP